tara:strand:+ start:141 stop:434 length:294 start_codon:yes stop_codon:yes gene_type:complete
VEDVFMDNLQELDLYTGLKIANFIEKNLELMPVNNFTSYVLGGCIVHSIGDPITFALEIVRVNNKLTTLTDVTLISMDEYLDLMLLNCYIKNPNLIG